MTRYSIYDIAENKVIIKHNKTLNFILIYVVVIIISSITLILLKVEILEVVALIFPCHGRLYGRITSKRRKTEKREKNKKQTKICMGTHIKETKKEKSRYNRKKLAKIKMHQKLVASVRREICREEWR